MMQKLYLEIASNSDDDDDDNIVVTLETLIVLFVLKFVEQPSNIKVHLVSYDRNALPESRITIKKQEISYAMQSHKEFQDETASNCNFPVIVNEENIVIAGLCGVCRAIVKHAEKSYAYLLGFKNSCLSAPAECSSWTKYCELDIVECTRNVLLFHEQLNGNEIKRYHLPNEIACFESHLNQPIRAHNIRKLAKKMNTSNDLKSIDNEFRSLTINSSKVYKQKSINDVPIEDLNIEHKYAEGPQISIADIILFPCFWLMISLLRQHATDPLDLVLPSISKWFEIVKTTNGIPECLNILVESNHNNKNLLLNYTVNFIPKFTLYKREAKGTKSRTQIFTRQNDIEQSLNKINQLDIEITSNSNEEKANDAVDGFDWNSLPFDALPEGGQLPDERLQRKKHQLFGLAKEIVKLAKAGDRIVDFCSGTGHLGIILACKLPKCQIYLLENKEESIMRAKQRVERLQLNNVTFFQCNLDYFIGHFDVGTSLHACGVASDIVLMRCIQIRANFVCCPCCYGKCTQMPHISYPRSSFFQTNNITSDDFMRIAHCADQAHDLTKTNNIEKSIQGQLCMDIVDTDRKLHSEESGYVTKLKRLHPENCTPKNRLLIGVI